MTRLYCPESLSANKTVSLQSDHVHYVRNVLRRQAGSQVNLFNGQDGEWLGEISVLAKNQGEVVLHRCLRQPEVEPEVILLFCPIKQDPAHYLIEKCTEVGVTVFQPVFMERGNIPRINQDKLQRIAIEASQQCERLSIPEVRELRQLREILDDWPKNTILYVCAERFQNNNPWAVSCDGTDTDDMQSTVSLKRKAALVGPEGGIHPKEIELLSRYPFVRFVSLGKNILRAETAAVVAAVKMILG